MQRSTYACGHVVDSLTRPPTKKKLAGPCLDCYKLSELAEADQREPGIEEFFGPLPDLRGSPSQVTWARSIRAKALVEVRDLGTSIAAHVGAMGEGRDYAEELAWHVQEAGRTLAGIDDGHWWIDARARDVRGILLDIAAAAFRRHLVDVLFQGRRALGVGDTSE